MKDNENDDDTDTDNNSGKPIISTRPLDRVEALDQSLAEAVARMKNDPAAAKACFAAMRDTISSAPDAAAWLFLVKKLVATALTHWTPATLDAAGFAEAASAAGFKVASYGKTTTVAREPAYPPSAAMSSAAVALNRSICKMFVDDVLKPALKRHASFSKKKPAGDDVAAFVTHLPALLRTGSLDEQGLAPRATGGQVAPLPRFALDDHA